MLTTPELQGLTFSEGNSGGWNLEKKKKEKEKKKEKGRGEKKEKKKKKKKRGGGGGMEGKPHPVQVHHEGHTRARHKS